MQVNQGDVIYYTGDMANASGWFVVSARVSANQIRLTEVNGGEDRVKIVSDWHIGELYQGHCDPRFVTLAAYNAWREQRGAAPLSVDSIVAVRAFEMSAEDYWNAEQRERNRSRKGY
jgi:hypothetical protein